MQNTEKRAMWGIRLILCILFAVSLSMAVHSALVTSTGAFPVALVAVAATTVFYLLFSLQNTGKILLYVTLGLIGAALIGYVFCTLTGVLPSFSDQFYEAVDVMAGYRTVSAGFVTFTVYAVSLLASLGAVLLMGRRICFVPLSAVTVLAYAVSAFTGNMYIQWPYVVLVLVCVCAAVPVAFERFEHKHSGALFDGHRLAPAAVGLCMCAVVAIVSVLMPIEKLNFNYYYISDFSRNTYSKNGVGEFYLAQAGIGSSDYYLGGPATLEFSKTVSVTSEEPLYLVASYFDEYTGYCWDISDKQKVKVESFEAPYSTLLQQEALTAADIDSKALDVSVEVLDMNEFFRNIYRGSLLIDLPKPGNRVIFSDGIENLFTNKYLKKGFKYDFTTLSYDYYQVYDYLAGGAYTGKAGATSAVSTVKLKAYEDTVHSRYTKLPDDMPTRVSELAKQIVAAAGAKTQVDSVRALMEYMYRFSYELDVPETPTGRDFVDYFLFDLKKGYCTYYASALAVMARSIGIPSRYVQGYCAQEEAGEGVVIDNTSAHAWVEIYFDGFGWVMFEPTPAAAETTYGIDTSEFKEQSSTVQGSTSSEEVTVGGDPSSGMTGTEQSSQPTVSEETTDTPTGTQSETPISEQPVVITESGFTITVADLLTALLVLLAAAVAVSVPIFIVKLRRSQIERLFMLDYASFTATVWHEIDRLMRFDGQRQKDDETPHQYMERLQNIYGGDVLIGAAESFEKVLYSRGGITDNDRAYAEAAYRHLDAAVASRHKPIWFNLNRYLLHRI
ncbi:MAG: transglutaminase domain-containing protein [Firmicutes bacterium]|nr:transglutaminase domain-containing protein [Bacillota bacterium]